MFEKVDIKKIKMKVADGKTVFSYAIDDEKQLNISAGKIHRGIAKTGSWEVQVRVLQLTVDKLPSLCSFGEIARLFEEMVS